MTTRRIIPLSKRSDCREHTLGPRLRSKANEKDVRGRSWPVCLLFALLGIGFEAHSDEALDIKSLVRMSSPAVVTVETQDRHRSQIGTASGFLISPDGLLVTNHHVIRKAHHLIAHLENGYSYPVEKVIGFNCETDLAVLQLKAKGVRFPFLRLGHTEGIEAGERVISIGSPLGLPATVSEGIISGIRREASSNIRFLQTTAAISPGSSGGPLIRLGSDVIGVTTFGILGGQDLNFAVPAEYIISILRKPTPTKLRTAGAKCKASPFVARTQGQQAEQQAAQVFDAVNETIGALIDLSCTRVAKSYQHYNNCISREIAKVGGLMTWLGKKTKTNTDAAKILLKCNGSWSRHGTLWTFAYYDLCIRSETSQYRLRGYRVK